eukprot:TRINITY_DN37904_c0_g1_i1.p1 TRINITY_DN37904_c0_g1~~TRINITY_DN37904_c0_g1_i1.p1  ORF type:complete len:325 (+),score=33.19 TRINITY_DN37904_c0_g1_i1:134-1108(+)
MVRSATFRHFVRTCPIHGMTAHKTINLGTLQRCGSSLLIEILKYLSSPTELIPLSTVSIFVRNCVYSPVLWRYALQSRGWLKKNLDQGCYTCTFVCRYTNKVSQVERTRLRKAAELTKLFERRQEYLSQLVEGDDSPLPSTEQKEKAPEENPTVEIKKTKSNRYQVTPRYLQKTQKSEGLLFNRATKSPSSKPKWAWGRSSKTTRRRKNTATTSTATTTPTPAAASSTRFKVSAAEVDCSREVKKQSFYSFGPQTASNFYVADSECEGRPFQTYRIFMKPSQQQKIASVLNTKTSHTPRSFTNRSKVKIRPQSAAVCRPSYVYS